MKKIEFKNGVVEVYETKEEMISILSEHLGRHRVEWYLDDDRFKDSFNPSTKESHYIKKIVAIKVPSEAHKTLMCFEHWNYKYDWDTHKNVELNVNTYSSGFACTIFRRPNKEKQECFLEYYNTVRDDDIIEKILNTFKVDDKIYFVRKDNTLASETIKYIGFDCEEEFVVEVGTDKINKKFTVVRINDDGSCSCYGTSGLYTSLELAKEKCLSNLKKKKDELRKKISENEKKIIETMSFVGNI